MKTTKKHFQEFKASFQHWQRELNCLDYRVSFQVIELDDSYADIQTDHEGKWALVRFAASIPDDMTEEDKRDFDPAMHGKHEATHLFFSKLSKHAKRRTFSEEELYQEEEGMVRVLERVLTKKGS